MEVSPAIFTAPVDESKYVHRLLQKDLMLNIFLSFSFKDLYSCMNVCRAWRDLTNDSTFWNNKLIQCRMFDVIDIFEQLVHEGVMTWKDAFRFSKVSSLFSKVFQQDSYSDEKIIARNPQLQNIRFPGSHYIPRFKVRYGNFDFTVVNCNDVEMRNIKTEKIQILKAESDVRITHLAVDRGFLFTLRADGMIVQWDYGKGEIVQILNTANTIEIIEELKGATCGRESFEVNEGLIFIKYKLPHARFTEVLPYSPMGSGIVLKHGHQNDISLTVDRFRKANNHFFSVSGCNVSFWDCKKYVGQQDGAPEEIQVDQQGYLTDVDIEHNILCVVKRAEMIKILDISSKKELRKLKSDDIHLAQMIVIGNLYIGISNKGINVIDLNSMACVKKIGNFFDFKKQLQNPEAFKELMQFCKANIEILDPINHPIDSIIKRVKAKIHI